MGWRTMSAKKKALKEAQEMRANQAKLAAKRRQQAEEREFKEKIERETREAEDSAKKENKKFKSSNDKSKKEYKKLKENNERLVAANESAGVFFNMLQNQSKKVNDSTSGVNNNIEKMK